MNWKQKFGLLGLFAMLAGCSANSDVERVGKARGELAPYWLIADWSIPNVFGLDRDGDGLVDLTPPKAAYAPTTFQVTVDACASAPPRGSVTSFLYELTLPDHVDTREGGCRMVYNVPASTAPYRLRITAFVSDGTAGVREFDIAPRNYVIVSMGDSMASGEGNPDVSGANPRWVDERCHRSANSGPARAARQLEDADPHSSVTFLSVACSGASISRGILGQYAGQDPGMNRFTLESQLVQVNRALCPVQRTCAPSEMPQIDALLLQIGANDIQFGEIVRKCAYPDWDCGNHVPDGFPGAVNALPGLYDQLGQSLKNSLNIAVVYASEYPDPTKDDVGNYCDSIFKGAVDDNFSTGPRTALGALLGYIVGGPVDAVVLGVAAERLHDGEITPSENQWGYTNLVVPLNQIWESAAGRNGWRYIGGIAAQFAQHGYCANSHYVVRYDESKASQQNPDGTMHPNGLGQQIYGSSISSAVSSSFPRRTFPEDDTLASSSAWGFVFSQGLSGSFAAAPDYSRNSLIASGDQRGIVNTVTWLGTGQYLVQFPKLGAYPGGNVQVTAYGDGPEHCKVGSWGSDGDTMKVNVNCFASDGSAVDTLFTASFISKYQSNGGINGYLWANDPTADSYVPNGDYQYNSTGASNTVSRSAVGEYLATFPGLSVVGGTVEVTAYGASNEACKVGNWGSANVNVRCFAPDGSPADAMFTLRFGSVGFNGGNSLAYAWADSPTAGEYEPSLSYQAVHFNSCEPVDGNITIERSSVGHYAVLVPALAPVGSTVKVTAYGDTSDSCKVAGWDGGATGTVVNVVCHDVTGAPVDSPFVVTYLTDQWIIC